MFYGPLLGYDKMNEKKEKWEEEEVYPDEGAEN